MAQEVQLAVRKALEVAGQPPRNWRGILRGGEAASAESPVGGRTSPAGDHASPVEGRGSPPRVDSSPMPSQQAAESAAAGDAYDGTPSEQAETAGGDAGGLLSASLLGALPVRTPPADSCFAGFAALCLRVRPIRAIPACPKEQMRRETRQASLRCTVVATQHPRRRACRRRRR